jgi:hypothetical protein
MSHKARLERLEAAARGAEAPGGPEPVALWRTILAAFLPRVRRLAAEDLDPERREWWGRKAGEMEEALQILDGCPAGTRTEAHCRAAVNLTALGPEDRLPFLEFDPAERLRECLGLDGRAVA